MTTKRYGWQFALAALVCAWLVNPPGARGGENGETLLPPDPFAPPVHILVVIPAASPELSRQVVQFDRALTESRGFLLRAQTLAEADVIVEFTGYRRTVGDRGRPLDWWDGQYRLLTASDRDARGGGEAASRFRLLIIGQEPWQMHPVIDLLARTLARALGRQARPEEPDSI